MIISDNFGINALTYCTKGFCTSKIYNFPKGGRCMEISNLFVVCMGLGTVFFGLICIILICTIMGAICKALIKEKPVQIANNAPAANGEIANKQEIVAACCAAIAEELGTSVSAIKVVSFKKL